MATFHFELVSPEKLVFSDEVEQVDLPGAEGDFGVLAEHAPVVSLLRPGIITIRNGGRTERLVVLGGFAEVSPKGLTVLADLAETVADFKRETIATRIEETKAHIETLEPSSELDKAMERLDHYHQIDHHLTGTAMH